MTNPGIDAFMYAVSFNTVNLSAGQREISTGWMATKLVVTDHRGQNSAHVHEYSDIPASV